MSNVGGGAPGGLGCGGSDFERSDSSDSMNLSFKYPWDSPLRKPGQDSTAAAAAAAAAATATTTTDNGDGGENGDQVPAGKSSLGAHLIKFSKSPLRIASSLVSSPPLESPSPSFDVDDAEDDDLMGRQQPQLQSPQNRIGSSQSTSDQEATESSSDSASRNPIRVVTSSPAIHSDAFARHPVNGAAELGQFMETPTSPLKKSALSTLFSSGSGTHLNAGNVVYMGVGGIISPSSPFSDLPESLDPSDQESRGMLKNRSISAGSLGLKQRGFAGSPPPTVETAAGVLNALSLKTGRSRRNSGRRLSSSLEMEYNVEESDYAGDNLLRYFGGWRSPLPGIHNPFLPPISLFFLCGVRSWKVV